jgi:hypothetical protein
MVFYLSEVCQLAIRYLQLLIEIVANIDIQQARLKGLLSEKQPVKP